MLKALLTMLNAATIMPNYTYRPPWSLNRGDVGEVLKGRGVEVGISEEPLQNNTTEPVEVTISFSIKPIWDIREVELHGVELWGLGWVPYRFAKELWAVETFGAANAIINMRWYT